MNEHLAELLFRILSDPRSAAPPDAAYLFGQTIDNQESSFAAATRSEAIDLLLLDTEPRSGYPGFQAWRGELLKSGFNANRIQPVPMPDDLVLNSRTESIALMEYCRAEEIRTLEIIAPPFHQPRAFMTAVTIALEENLDLAIHSRPGKAFCWSAVATHSQGELEATRAGLIHTELERIEIYQAKGDLASNEAVLDYLNRRDG